MNKKLYTYTFAIFVITLLIAIFIFTVTFLGIFIIKAIPPLIFLFIVGFCFIMLTIHYYKCLLYLKDDTVFDSKKRNRIRGTNIFVLCIALIYNITVILISLYAIILMKTFSNIMLYFLTIYIFSLLYWTNAFLLNKAIK